MLFEFLLIKSITSYYLNHNIDNINGENKEKILIHKNKIIRLIS